MKRIRTNSDDDNEVQKKLRTSESSIYYTPLEIKIYNVLYDIILIIQSQSTKLSKKLEILKETLKQLNIKYLGQSVYQCQSTSFLEYLIQFETAQFSKSEAELYGNNVMDLWNQYMKYNLLPYLSGPIKILKTKRPENDDQELSAIMTFIKYEWDVLYDGCPYPKNPLKGEHYNVIGFLMGQNECHCTCITALFLITADCLGLFPEYIFAQIHPGHIYVVTHHGLVIEGAGKEARDIIQGSLPRVPVGEGESGIRTPKEFLQSVGWYSHRQIVRKKKTLDVMKSQNIQINNSVVYSNFKTFDKEFEDYVNGGNMSQQNDKEFVLKWLSNFSEFYYDYYIKEKHNKDYLRLYYEFVLLFNLYFNTYLFKSIDVTDTGPSANMMRIPNDKYKLMLNATTLYLINSNYSNNDHGFLKNIHSDQEFWDNDVPEIDINEGLTTTSSSLFHELLKKIPKFMDDMRFLCSEPVGHSVVPDDKFKSESVLNIKIIIGLWQRIVDYNIFRSRSSTKILNLSISELKQMLMNCF